MSKDQITLFPTTFDGDINTPPSKSLSHRALICAALAEGESRITNVLFSEDIKATIKALELLGAKFEILGHTVIVKGTRKLKLKDKEVDCNESGSTIRFLIPLFSLTHKEIHFTGKQSLINRPQSIYKDIFDKDNNTFDQQETKIVVKGAVKPRDYYIKGNVSSQFFSGLMFALPLLEEDSMIYIEDILESKSYIDLTIDILEHYGIQIDRVDDGYFIEGNQKYKNKDYRVEGDYSQAAFYLVGGILNGRLSLNDLNHESFQGDKQIIDIIKQMKGKVVFMENGFTTTSSETRSTTIDLSDCPDLGPIVSLLAALSKGTTHITNAGRLRIKESDRIESTVQTLKALGANIHAIDDEIIVTGHKMLEGGVTVDSFNDHRIAMMIAIAVSRCKKEVTLTRPNAVNKSYPHFFEDYKSVGGKLK